MVLQKPSGESRARTRALSLQEAHRRTQPRKACEASVAVPTINRVVLMNTSRAQIPESIPEPIYSFNKDHAFNVGVMPTVPTFELLISYGAVL